MDRESIMLSEISQSDKDKYHDFTYMWNLMNKINQQTRQKQIHRYKEQADSSQLGGSIKSREGIKQKQTNKQKLIDTDNSMEITRGDWE